MSQLLIQQYLNQLATLKKVSGSQRESVIREAFKDLLKGWAKSHDLVFIPEYEFETKFKRGYPQDNIIFEDSKSAILIQDREEVMRALVDDQKSLEKLLNLFFGYERKEISEFRKAVEQFKTDLPAVLEGLREMIEAAHKENAGFRKAAAFLEHAREADREGGRIVVDSETTLSGVPPEAWEYRLGNRSALEWVLDQHKESKPKDPTIREKFDTYRFKDYKEKVIDLLGRVTRVSVETQKIVEAMRKANR
jgi:predicted helicase